MHQHLAIKKAYDLITKTRVMLMDEKKFLALCKDIAAEIRPGIEREYSEKLKALISKVEASKNEYRDLEEKYMSLEKENEVYKAREKEREQARELLSIEVIEEAKKRSRKAKEK